MSEQKLKIELTVRQALELIRICHKLQEFEVFADCKQIIHDAVVEQAYPEEVDRAADKNYVYFSETIREREF